MQNSPKIFVNVIPFAGINFFDTLMAYREEMRKKKREEKGIERELPARENRGTKIDRIFTN